ncbi:hypothetical protein M9Y10_045657 [Tritrichomonas musculus]|uniref:Palmitoyltransferase n=1 Tax=Tritrichomonas musculus TaxID=1915356 RepID=A0ABR2JVU9_9EUKA
MARNPLTFLDILPRIIIFLIWTGGTSVYMWDVSTSLIKASKKKYIIQDWIFIGVFIFLSIIFLWTYYVACWSDPGSTERFYKKLGVLDKILEKKIPPELTLMPVCKVCHLPKPERTHHCSRCNQCYFRFDHHCPLIGNCVALNNFKGFILMPIYGGILCILLSIELFMQHRKAFYYSIIPLPFAAYFIYFSLSYCRNIVKNVTTLETFTFKVDNIFGSNRFKNFQQFFDGFFGVFLPTKPKISGFYWSGEQVVNMVKDLEEKMKKDKIAKRKERKEKKEKESQKDETNDVDDIIDNIDKAKEVEGDIEKKLI